MFTLVTTDYFLRRARKFFKKHPNLRARFAQVTADLQQDPFAPHLDYHHLQGKLKGMQAVRLTDSYRITLTIVIAEKEIILLDIGSHDDVYR
ncbi:MAG: type II toxin-antitoxin system mRNA interferase toxin, RelE/StbE family [Caldilinea sp. CFX5]|nr:type II toxin-antitoxin system mRNA interferase toxin, RelE/StbE family [Caldilinea sp. CFX5]